MRTKDATAEVPLASCEHFASRGALSAAVMARSQHPIAVRREETPREIPDRRLDDRHPPPPPQDPRAVGCPGVMVEAAAHGGNPPEPSHLGREGYGSCGFDADSR